MEGQNFMVMAVDYKLWSWYTGIGAICLISTVLSIGACKGMSMLDRQQNPQHMLMQLAEAIQQGDKAKIEQYIDFESVINALTEEAISSASVDNQHTLNLNLHTATRDEIETIIEQRIDEFIESLAAKSQVSPLEVENLSIEQSGSIATVEFQDFLYTIYQNSRQELQKLSFIKKRMDGKLSN